MKTILFYFAFFLAFHVNAQTTRLLPIIRETARSGFQFISPETQLPLNPTIWDEAEPFVNGFSKVLKDGKFTFVNSNGQTIGIPQYQSARNFNNGLAAVKVQDAWGFIDQTGRLLIPCQHEIVYDFTSDVTAVYGQYQWCIIDVNGNIVSRPDIDVCHGFKNGIAYVEKAGRYGQMTTDGQLQLTNTLNSNSQTYRSISNTPAANVCPNNIDFENGNFNNWRCYTGRVDSVGNLNVITVTPSAPVANRHRIISRTTPSALDPMGLFPINPPDGSNFAVRLGNSNVGAQAERIQYSIRVPLNDSNFSVRYDYAVVFEDPGHTNWTQPRFIARVFDSITNAYIDCASFEYISTSSLPGFQHSTVDTSVIFKTWSTVFISLRGYAGKTMYLEFTTADCVRRGHWGYAYVDVQNNCGESVQMQYDCNFPNIATLDAPPGFQTYNWWNQQFSQNLGSGQQLVLNPGPQVNSTIWVEMIPFNDFGCRDTLPVLITGSFNASFSLSDTVANCAPHRFTFTNNNQPSSRVDWDFGDGTTGTGDVVSHVYTLPGTYTVTMQVILPSGCTSSAVAAVTVLQPAATFDYSGGNYCNQQQVAFTAAGNQIDSIAWHFGDGQTLTTTQLNVTHLYQLAGTFIPSATVYINGGCTLSLPGTDTIRIEQLQAAFTSNQSSTCSSSSVQFISQSSSLFGINSFQWNFGDGNTANAQNVNHVYAQPGNYDVTLIITGIFGCKDTTQQNISINIHSSPDVNITGPGQTCAGSTINLQANTNPADSISTYAWTVSNGATSQQNNINLSFTQAGTYTVQLISSTIQGCTDTTSHQVIVNAVPQLQTPPNQQVCNGFSFQAINFISNVPNTDINWVNDFAGIGLSATGTGDIPSFMGTSNATTAAIANISATPVANGCTGSPVDFTLSVLPIPVISVPAPQTVCSGSLTAAVVFTSFNAAVASFSYSWTNDQPSIGLPASGTGDIPSFVAINNGSTPIVAQITISASNSGCSVTPVVFIITVNPTPHMLQPANMDACNNTIIPSIQFSATPANSTFNWNNNLPAIGLPATGTGNINSFTALNSGSSALIAELYVTPEFEGCTGDTLFFNITVNPIPAIQQPPHQTVCNGSAIAAINFGGSVANTQFTWTNNSPSIGLPASGSGNIPAFNPVNNDISIDTATITVTPAFATCIGSPVSFQLIVLPRANVVQPLNQFLCNNQYASVFPFTGPLNNTIYQWTNSNTAIGLAASGSGNIPSFLTINNGTTAVSAIITVTATANGCTGNEKQFTITVDPTPDMAQPNDQEVCNATRTAAVNFTGNVAGTTFSWINSNPAIGLPANGTGNIPSFTALNNNTYPITAIISITGVANSCNSITRVFTIRVNPSPVIDPLNDRVFCDGTIADSIELTGTLSGTNYSWTNTQPSIGLAASGTGNIPEFLAVNNGTIPVIAVINVTGDIGASCPVAIKTFKITVHPTPLVNAGNDNTICQGVSTNLSASGAQQYQWFPGNGMNCTTCSNPRVTPTDTTTYYLEGTSRAGCKGYDTVLVNVIPPFDMLVSPDDTICTGRSVRLLAQQANRYEWNPATGLNNTQIANPIASPSVTTRYRVVGYDGHQCFTDTAYVQVLVGPDPTLNIGPDVTATTGSTVTFNPTVSQGPITQWSWTPSTHLSCNDCPNPTTTVSTNATYTLTVTNSFGCIVSDEVSILSTCKGAQVFVPNAFTPDGDGLNDVLMIRGSGVTIKTFRVFNRWGVLIFERLNFSPNEIRNGWDGKVRGVLAHPDVYVYTAEVICDNGVIYTYKGNTTILK